MFLKLTNSLQAVIAIFSVCILFSCDRRSEQHNVVQIDSTDWPSSFGFGRTASLKEIDSLNIDVSPDGEGLPPGLGNVIDGHQLYAQKCARCHGITGTEGPYNKLVAVNNDKDSLQTGDKTIGNYWPYATTLYDYIYRAMPYDSPGTLSGMEVYSITAFLLYKNNIIDSTISLDSRNLPQVTMPAKDLFVNDDRKGGPEIR